MPRMTNAELLQLTGEVSGCLTLKLSIDKKYKLSKMREQVDGLIKVYNQFRTNTIKELNLEGADQFVIDDCTGKTIVNPDLVKYNETMKPLDDEEQEFDFPKMPFEWIKNIETEMNFPLLYQFFEEPNI